MTRADPKRLLTLDDVADRLHKSRRWLVDWLREHPYYVKVGRTKLFREADIENIQVSLATKYPSPDIIAATNKLPGAMGRPKPQHPGFIYFIESGGFIKIGYSKKWEKRVLSLKSANPQKIDVLLVIEGTREREGDLHARFQESRIRGEWYQPTQALLDYIDELTP